MSLKNNFLFILLSSFIVWAFMIPPKTEDYPDLENILNKLYHANGNYKHILPKIKIVVKTENAASYNRWTKTINIDRKTLELCNRLSKPQSALAFLLGHELTHAYQYDKHPNNLLSGFLSYSKKYPQTYELEKAADIQGGFMAFLAGYDPSIISELIANLYKEYKIKDKILPDYPPYAERQTTTIDVLEKVQQLIAAYEAANYLTVVGNYDLAIKHYEYILIYYQGADIYNNLGLTYLLQAMAVSGKNADTYLLPMELDLDSRLKRPRAKELSASEKTIRLQLLNQAMVYLDNSITHNPNHFPSQLNKLCGLLLQEQYEKAINFYQTFLYRKTKNLIQGSKVELAIAIAYLYQQPKKGRDILKKIQQNGASIIRPIATYNLAKSNDEKVYNNWRNNECTIQLPRTGVYPMTFQDLSYLPLENDVSVQIAWKNISKGKVVIAKSFSNSCFFHFNNSSFSLPSKINLQNPDYQIFQTHTGVLLHFASCKVIVKMNTNGHVEEWVKYFEY